MSTRLDSPRHLLTPGSPGLKKLDAALSNSRTVMLFLDYDGTLVPIRKRPGLALPTRKIRNLLRDLLGRPGVAVAVVTGRSLSDIRRKLPVRGIVYAANHGLEIQAWGPTWVHPKAASRIPFLRRLRTGLSKRLTSVRGIQVEDKGLTLSVHYRNAGPRASGLIMRNVRSILERFPGLFTLSKGKKVVEVRPDVSWDKGKAVLWIERLVRLRNPLPVYLGDDRTDEDAFRSLRARGITVLVGHSRKTGARYYLKDSEEVCRFLRWCIEHGH